jgi:ankyrin repeat protein
MHIHWYRMVGGCHMCQIARLILVASLLSITESARAEETTDDQLRTAVYDGDVKTVQKLLPRSPTKTAVNKALYDATLLGHQDIALALIEHGANVNFADGPHNDTPLMKAAEKNSLETIRACLRHGADPNLKCDFGWTALIHAACHGHVDAVKILATHRGTRINAHDRYDFTALTTAVSRGRAAVVEYLLTTRADLTIKTDRGETALDIARANAKNPASSDELRDSSRAITRMLESKLRTHHQ